MKLAVILSVDPRTLVVFHSQGRLSLPISELNDGDIVPIEGALNIWKLKVGEDVKNPLEMKLAGIPENTMVITARLISHKIFAKGAYGNSELLGITRVDGNFRCASLMKARKVAWSTLDTFSLVIIKAYEASLVAQNL